MSALLVALLVSLPALASDPPKLPVVPPEEAGMDARILAGIDPLVTAAIAAGEMPGCVVCIGRQGKIVLLKAYGDRQVEPERVPTTTTTVYDLASLTKPIATATSVMRLVENGKLDLSDPAASYLPDFGASGKQGVTVYHLLTHQSGLVADNPLSDYVDGPEKAWQRIFALDLRGPPGERFIYSDVGFLVLGEIVRRVSGQPLGEFARQRIFEPLGMHETGFRPSAELRSRAAPTEQRDGEWMQGKVHDPRAWLLEGVAGHAGLFSTATDLATYAQMMLGGGEYQGVRILKPETVVRMTEPYPLPRGRRGLGWDMRTGYSKNRGRTFSPQAFGHGGFTGTSLWIDPELELFVIFLSNRLHPDGQGSVNPLAGEIGTLAADAIRDRGQGDVLTGIDILRREGFRRLEGRRVGLITNQTGIDRRGTSTANLLHQAPEVHLVALFSPEHGLAGKLDQSHIGDTRDPATGLPVYSLYGETRRPTAEMLKGIDTLVFDIQDIGTRFYTYISTMGHAMQAAAERGIRFVVLDRPNPIGGVEVAGPLLDEGSRSFVGFHPMPVRHGMTIGELARMFRAELKLDLDLEVVQVENWRRSWYFDETGLPWINPSPNMRSLTEAILYPGIGLLETTNLSVGRGTETPFELFGAPWFDGEKLAAALREADLPGVSFRAITFTPQASVFARQQCSGVGITITDRGEFEPVRTGLEIAHQLRTLYPDTWSAAAYRRLLGNAAVHKALLAGKPVEQIEANYRPALAEFIRRRADYLLYK